MFALVAALTCALSAHAYYSGFYYNGVYYDLYDNDETPSCPAAYNLDDWQFAEVTNGPVNFKYSGSVNIPSSVYYNGKTYPVKGIGGYAFRECTGLTSVTIPNSVVYIDEYAFYKCNAMPNITIPSSVIYIGDCTFEYCRSLTSVRIPDAVYYIGETAFYYCTGLKSVTIPGSARIGNAAFYGCTGLTSVTSLSTTPPYIYGGAGDDYPLFSVEAYNNATLYVPKGCRSAYLADEEWGNFANIVEMAYDFEVNGIFYHITGTNTVEVTYRGTNYNSYSGSVNIPSSVSYGGKTYTVTAIGDHAFDMSGGLTDVTIPSTVTVIGESAFNACTGLTGVTIPTSVTTIKKNAFCWSGLREVLIPNSVTSLGWGAFNMCESLTSVTIAAGMTAVSDYAFATCHSLENVTIPNTVKTIGEYAFGWCDAMPNITIPSSVTSIGNSAFWSCTALTSVTCLGNTPPTMGNANVFSTSVYSNATLMVPKGRKSVYQSANWWKNFEDINELVYDFVSNGIYYTITGTNTVEVAPATANTYSGNVVIPSSVTHNGTTYQVKGIGMAAFGMCVDLTSVTIPNSVTYISAFAFVGSPALTSIVIPNSVTRIGDSAFEECVGLTSITIPNSVTTIAKRAFRHCESLTSVTIGSGVTSIGDEAF